jgi:hypothetical protein
MESSYPTEAEVAKTIGFQTRHDVARNGTVVTAMVVLKADYFIADEMSSTILSPEDILEEAKAELAKMLAGRLVTEELVHEVGRLNAIVEEARKCPHLEHHLELING